MRNHQRVIVAIALAVLALNVLFPPRRLFEGPSVGRHFLLSPMVARHYVDQNAFRPAFIDTNTLIVSSVVILGISSVLLAVMRRGPGSGPRHDQPLQAA